MIETILFILILFSAMVIHEYAHGWVAYKLGDPTAKEAGRLTLNPLKHIDKVGTIYLPAFLIVLRILGMNVFVFGWAKPVPVNFSRLRNPKKDIMLVGGAGPSANFIFATIVFFVEKHISLNLELATFCKYVIIVNIIFGVFNMIPIPPLDGSRIVMGLLPKRLLIPYAKLERFGFIIVILLIYVLYEGPVGNIIGTFIDHLEHFVGV